MRVPFGRILGWVLGTLASLAVAALVAAWLALRASLPQIEGEAPLAGLEAPVAVERDAAGIPVIRGGSRADVARATGYVHAQDRLFQMDLLRRTGAGELAALLGPGLLDVDRRIRLHQFRQVARAVVAGLGADDRELLEAYAGGVNSAIDSLRARPFEYLLLGQAPEPWRAEDSILVVHAMWLDLQGLVAARDELRRDRLAAVLPEAAYRFLVEPEPSADAALDGSRLPQAAIPTAEQFDLRKLDRGVFERLDGQREKRLQSALEPDGRKRSLGSNNWAVAGARAARGALLANDMHLGLNVPNIWFRARLVVEPDGLDVAGATLPGVPLVVAGSNGHVAWGFTNSYGDFQDVIRVERGPGTDSYLTPDGPRRFELANETLEVADGEPESLVVRKTIWGPVVPSEVDALGGEVALAWTAHRPGATDMALRQLERARDLDDAAAIIAGAGMPAQNVMIADRHGRIGWVLSGRLPRRRGLDPLRPSSWHVAGSGWDGWIARAESPRLLDPPAGFAWTANARVVGGAALALIGDGDYASAARARQIRDRLAALENAGLSDMLAIQLDDRADYAGLWQPIFRQALAHAGEGEGEAERLVAGWSGHAATDDAGYRLLRDFEQNVTSRAFEMIAAEAFARWPDFRWQTPEPFGDVALRLVRERPANLLDPRFADWDAWLSQVATDTVRARPKQCVDLASCTWGKVNSLEMRHPISQALPLASRLLDMPGVALPGDWSMPRAQGTGFGASERFGVSPGREAEGYFHMPGGQSGHPLSPFYRAGHADWVAGRATPFLPGPAAHVLALHPPGA